MRRPSLALRRQEPAACGEQLDLPRQLGLGDVLEFAWGYTLAQRLRLAREYLQGQHVRVLPGANTLSAARIARWILPCPLS